jgi:hypothetical protein
MNRSILQPADGHEAPAVPLPDYAPFLSPVDVGREELGRLVHI